MDFMGSIDEKMLRVDKEMFSLRNEEKYLPYASQLDLQVTSQEFPYRLHDDYGFSEHQRRIDEVERINLRGGKYHE